jgi:hypothetical protein
VVLPQYLSLSLGCAAALRCAKADAELSSLCGTLAVSASVSSGVDALAGAPIHLRCMGRRRLPNYAQNDKGERWNGNIGRLI